MTEPEVLQLLAEALEVDVSTLSMETQIADVDRALVRDLDLTMGPLDVQVVQADVGLLGRAALDDTVADVADPDGQ